MWAVGSSSLTRDRTQVLCWELRVLATRPPGKSYVCVAFMYVFFSLTREQRLGGWILDPYCPAQVWHVSSRCSLNYRLEDVTKERKFRQDFEGGREKKE